jgi:hypothetical protein
VIQRTAVALRFYAFYVETKVGKTGLTVTVDVYENGSSIVSGASATEIGGGLYAYVLASGSVDANGEYAAIFKTSTTTVDAQHVPSLWVTPAWADNVDAAISTRATPAQVNTEADTALSDVGLTSTITGRVDVAVSTRASQTTLNTLDDYVDTEVAAIKAKTDLIGSVSVTYSSIVVTTGVLNFVPGDDYYAAEGRAYEPTYSGVPSLTGATVTMALRLQGGGTNAFTVTGSVLSSTQLRFEPTSAQTLLLAPDSVYDYQVQAVLSGTSHVTTLEEGTVTTMLNIATP